MDHGGLSFQADLVEVTLPVDDGSAVVYFFGGVVAAVIDLGKWVGVILTGFRGHWFKNWFESCGRKARRVGFVLAGTFGLTSGFGVERFKSDRRRARRVGFVLAGSKWFKLGRSI